MGFDKNGYYNTNKIKSYNARYYFVASERGLGKTYGEKKALLKGWIRRKERFMYIYRTGADLENGTKNWFDQFLNPAPLDKIKPFKPDEFKWVNGNSAHTAVDLEFRGEVIGFFRSISITNAIKYEVFPLDIAWIVCDEVVPMLYKKIPGIDNEPEALETIAITADHDSKHPKYTIKAPSGKFYPRLRIIMFCNPRNRNSPFYEYLNIPALKFGIKRTNRDVVCEMLEPTFEDTEGGLPNTARKCSPYLETNSYVRKIPKKSHPWMSVRIGFHYYTWYDCGNNISVIKKCKKHTKGCRYYLGSMDNITEQEDSIYRHTDEGTCKKYLQKRANECVDYFESVETKCLYIQDVL